jgi:hypothetical protein
MAIINVSPDVDITELIGSSQVAEGDVLLLTGGIYNQMVIIRKNYVRIISENGKAVFDGNNELNFAFILDEAIGIEICGLIIQNYVGAGIVVLGGSANRFLCNQVSELGYGYYVVKSDANFIWRNEISKVMFGILLQECSANRVVENSVKESSYIACGAFFSEMGDNAIIGNLASDCEGYGFMIYGTNNLIYGNRAVRVSSIGYSFSDNGAAIKNKNLEGNNGIIAGYSNMLIAANEVRNGSGTGLEVDAEFGIISGNRISCNLGTGIILDMSSGMNFIYDNKVTCNTPDDIAAGGNGNILLENLTGC